MEAQALVLLLLTLALPVLVLLAISQLLGSRTRRRRSRSRLPTPPLKNVVINDPTVVQRMLIDHADAFSWRPTPPFPKDFSGTHSINSVPYGPTWRALRGNLIAGLFHPTRLGVLAPLQRDAVDGLIAGLSSSITGRRADDIEAVVIRDRLNAAVFGLVARMCLGDSVGKLDVRTLEREVGHFIFTFMKDSALAGSRLARLLHWRRWRRYDGIVSRLSKLVLPIIATRKRRSQHDGTGIRCYVDSLVDLRIPNNDDVDATTTAMTGSKRPLTDRELVRLVFEFLGANTVSVVSCVEWTLAHLVIRPEVQEKLHHEITSASHGDLISEDRLRTLPYLRATILESLRLHPPLSVILRNVDAHDLAAFGGCAPPAPANDGGTQRVCLVVKVGKVGRNRSMWTDPDEFRPERFLTGGEAEGVGPVAGPKEIRMLPFGAGRRYCPGVEVAMIHVGYFLAALVRDFEWALPVDGHSIDLTEKHGFFMVMKTPLRARVTPRGSPHV